MTKTILEEYLPAYSNAIKTCEELEKIQDNKIKKLEKKLEIATKALERINDLSSDNDGINDGGIIWCALNSLKEMEGVK